MTSMLTERTSPLRMLLEAVSTHVHQSVSLAWNTLQYRCTRAVSNTCVGDFQALHHRPQHTAFQKGAPDI